MNIRPLRPLLALAILLLPSLRAASGVAGGGDPAAASKVIDLWPEGVPGLKPELPPEGIVNNRVVRVSHPTLTCYPAPADLAAGTAIIICPGGGYDHLSMENEGSAVAHWLNSIGVSAFVLKYRLKEYGAPAPLQDVLRAIRLVRSQAADFAVRPDRVGVIGFSAGGHVAACAATLYDDPDGKTGAKLDEVSARPDFALLLYPVITMAPPGVENGSRGALLGRTPTPDQLTHWSADQHVTRTTPPTFLVQAGDDRTVPADNNSVQFYLALRKAGVPAELHFYEAGGHGFGMTSRTRAAEWPLRAAEWLKGHGWLAK